MPRRSVGEAIEDRFGASRWTHFTEPSHSFHGPGIAFQDTTSTLSMSRRTPLTRTAPAVLDPVFVDGLSARDNPPVGRRCTGSQAHQSGGLIVSVYSVNMTLKLTLMRGSGLLFGPTE